MRGGENRGEPGAFEKQAFELFEFTEELRMAMFLLISPTCVRHRRRPRRCCCQRLSLPVSQPRCRAKSQA
jgi:hypothetical protein